MTPAPLLRRLARFRTPFASASASAIPCLPPVQLSLPSCTQAAPSAAVSVSGTSPPSVFRAVNHDQVTRARASLEIPASKSQRPTPNANLASVRAFRGSHVTTPGVRRFPDTDWHDKIIDVDVDVRTHTGRMRGWAGTPAGRRIAVPRSPLCHGARRPSPLAGMLWPAASRSFRVHAGPVS